MIDKLVAWLALPTVEGLRLKAYKCSAGVWTIGIGNTYYENGTPVKQGDVITNERAFKLAVNIALDYSTHVQKSVKRALTENQSIALASFCYNVGKGAFTRSKVLQMLNAGRSEKDIAEVFAVSFITAAGKPSPGVKARRAREVALFLKP